MWYHKEEENTVGILLKYGIEHGDEQLTFTYGENEAYVCEFQTSFESSNIADVEDYGAQYDEFIVVTYSVFSVIKAGEHYSQGDGGITVTYFDMPSTVTTMRNQIIYPA